MEKILKILIVEDDKELSHITELELTHEGFFGSDGGGRARGIR